MLLLIDLGTKNNNFSDEKFINKASIGAFELYYKKLKLITNLGFKYSVKNIAGAFAINTLTKYNK